MVVRTRSANNDSDLCASSRFGNGDKPSTYMSRYLAGGINTFDLSHIFSNCSTTCVSYACVVHVYVCVCVCVCGGGGGGGGGGRRDFLHDYDVSMSVQALIEVVYNN